MHISLNWLQKFININNTPDELAKILTSIGLEVGSISKYESVKGGMQGIVTGEVVTCEKHPNADKLSLTTVNIGSGSLLKIVCGAPNVQAGQKVVVATIGTVLFKGDESFTIKESKIRGELSQGMICAEDEIGIGNSHAGIIVLPENVSPGIPASEYFNITSDVVLEVDITPNRIDAASHIGVARDLAAFFRTKYIKPSVDAFMPDNNDFPVEVFVENTEACGRYCGVTISGIAVKESPAWLKDSLKAVGLNPINNIVDITNYVLLETGQPLHAFDAEMITGNKVVVKCLPQGTAFTTLDGTERKLFAEDLMICNTEEGMCIAGVYGGVKSGVTENTTKIFLESAYFTPAYVRRTAKKHGLSTDASFRFERGVDPNNVPYALKRAALLIKEIAGGLISSELSDSYSSPIRNFEIDFSFKNAERLIGKKIEKDEILSILKHLEIEIKEIDSDLLKLFVPPYRVDVTREADIIEEILRIYGYNNVEVPLSVSSSLSFIEKPQNEKLVNLISDYLTANGFNEIMCNSLTKSQYYEDLTSYKKENLTEVLNPLSSDLNVMRQSLIFGGLESVLYNVNRKNQDLRLFEFGNCYRRTGAAEGSVIEKYGESRHLALFVTGDKTAQSWTGKTEASSFFQTKSFTENILKRLGFKIEKLEKNHIGADVYSDIISDGISYVLAGKEIAFSGIISKKLLRKFDIEQDVYFSDIHWTNLLGFLGSNRVRYTEIPKYPEVKRDLALLIDKSVTFEEIKRLAFKAEKKLLKEVSLFDVYEGANLGEGKKSYAVSFILQDESKTLTDKQIEQIMSGFVGVFEKELGARIR